jgi:hypothetical protein
MKRLGMLLIVFAALHLCAPRSTAETATSGFDKLKSLVGEWEGNTTSGKTAHVSYRITSGGSAVLETLKAADEPEMVTVYHHDGDSLMMTHYCMANNQPRMRVASTGAGGKQLTFDFVDATNLASPSAGHMHRLVMVFEDADHLTANWTWRENDKEQIEGFRLTRKK